MKISWKRGSTLVVVLLGLLLASCGDQATSNPYTQSELDAMIYECLADPLFEPLRDGMRFDGVLEGANALVWVTNETLSGELVLLTLFADPSDATRGYDELKQIRAHVRGGHWILVGPKIDEENLESASLGALVLPSVLESLNECLEASTDKSRVPSNIRMVE